MDNRAAMIHNSVNYGLILESILVLNSVNTFSHIFPVSVHGLLILLG